MKNHPLSLEVPIAEGEKYDSSTGVPTTELNSDVSPASTTESTPANATQGQGQTSYLQNADGTYSYAYNVGTLTYVYDLNWVPQYAFDDQQQFYYYDADGALQPWTGAQTTQDSLSPSTATNQLNTECTTDSTTTTHTNNSLTAAETGTSAAETAATA
eukprot:Lankesteria_metandrocarpae@DN11083_c0_g1_i1.p1